MDIETQSMLVNNVVHDAFKNALLHGFWADNPTFGDKIALIHSELSEALEEFRAHKGWYYEVDGKPEGIGVELVDAIIRICDLWGAMGDGVDMETVLAAKMHYNETRPYKHGKRL